MGDVPLPVEAYHASCFTIEKELARTIWREKGVSTIMLFHLSFEVLEEIVLPEAKTMRNEWLGPQLQKVMESGKVKEAGLLVGKRGGFFLVDVDNPEELYTLFGPELYDTSRVEAHAVMSMEAAGQMFGQWAEEDR
jgi:hypothetical protein